MAKPLMEDEKTVDLAAVAAQIHLELHVKAFITSAVVDDVSPLRRVSIEADGNTWGPTTRWLEGPRAFARTPGPCR
jgi:hypothetical protein